VLDRVAAVWDGSVETFEAAWTVEEYDPQLDMRLGDMRFSFAPSLHYTTCYSIKIDAGGSTIAYSADTAPTERLARFAHGADLFLCEASLKDAKGDSTERGHMDATEAGREAARAGVKRLLLTHVPAENGSDEVIERAAAEYSGPIEIAHPGLRIEV
jgi:ribonuclease BN (tRNA processing enzyme)